MNYHTVKVGKDNIPAAELEFFLIVGENLEHICLEFKGGISILGYHLK